jgi:hypothetical protein
MITVIQRDQIALPIVWLNVHESGFGSSSVEACIERIEEICAKLFQEQRELQLCIYDDIPASTGKAFGFVCNNIDVLRLAREVQIEFNRSFGAKNVSVSLF